MDWQRAASIRHKMAGVRFRALRTRFDLSVEEAGQALSLTPDGIRQRELGWKPIAVDEFWSFCRYLGLPDAEAYGAEERLTGEAPSEPILRLRRKLLGASLGEGRAEREWTPEQAAAEAHMGLARLEGAELGEESLSLGEVELLAGLYGMSPGAMLGGKLGTPPPVPAARAVVKEATDESRFSADVNEFLRRPEAERFVRAAMSLAQLDEEGISALEDAVMFLRGSV